MYLPQQPVLKCPLYGQKHTQTLPQPMDNVTNKVHRLAIQQTEVLNGHII
jgi:hypothetical protein